MCGICGIFHYKDQKSLERDALAIMNTMLTHRGPDDEGWLVGDLNVFARHVLSSDRLGRCGMFNVDYVQKMIREHEERKTAHSYRLWALMCFQLWYELFIEPRAIRPPAKMCKRWGLHLD